MGDRYVNSNNNSQSQSQIQSQIQSHSHNRREIWDIDANNIYGYALMQKLPYKDFNFTDITLDEMLNSPDDKDYAYWVI